MSEKLADTAVEKLVDYAESVTFDALEPAVVKAARQRILDTVGCGVAGTTAPPFGAAAAVAYPVASGGARIWGSGARVSPEDAAFANGIALRYLDFNDAYRGAVDVGHPSDNLGALLALADERHLSGARLVEGMVVAYEVQCRLAERVPYNELGWDQPCAVVLSSALGAGRMLGLDHRALAEAVALAVVPNMAMHQARVPELTWWKGCAASMGARQGLFAARLAEQGMEGPNLPIEGKNGLWAQLGEAYGIPDLGQGPALGVQQANIKMWPVRDSCQLVIDTARALRDQGVAAARIDGIHVLTYKSNYRWAVADPELWKPQTRETADHSVPFCCAVTLIDGVIDAATFERGRFLDDDVLGLIGRMKIEVSDEFTSRTPEEKTCRIEVLLAGGEVVTEERVLAQASIEAGLSDDVIEAKFRSLVAPFMEEGAAERLLQAVDHIDEAEDVASVVDLLAWGS